MSNSTLFSPNTKPVTYTNIAIAIAEFEKTLVTTDRFDQFMNGNHKKLRNTEQADLKKFIETGCTSCHNRPASYYKRWDFAIHIKQMI